MAALQGSAILEGPSGLKEMVSGFNISVTFLELDDYDAVFSAIESGQADAGIPNRNFANINAHNYRIKKTPLIFQPANLKFAFPRDLPSSPALKSQIDQNLNQLQQDSESVYYSLLAKYFEAEVAQRKVEVWPSWLSKLIQLTAISLLMFGTIIVISRTQVRRKTRELKLSNEELIISGQRYREIFNATSDALDTGPRTFEWRAQKSGGELFWVEVALKHTTIAGKAESLLPSAISTAAKLPFKILPQSWSACLSPCTALAMRSSPPTPVAPSNC